MLSPRTAKVGHDMCAGDLTVKVFRARNRSAIGVRVGAESGNLNPHVVAQEDLEFSVRWSNRSLPYSA
jgi:hypothetical protein